MSFEKQKNKLMHLDEWFLTDMGCPVREAFLSQVDNFKSSLRGETLLQLGCCVDDNFLKALGFTYKWTVAPYPNTDAEIISLVNHLPFDRNSIDCIIVPLVLEAFGNKEDLIDEIDRVLKPMGSIVLFGINPMSLWGWWMRFGSSTCFGNEKAALKSVLSLKFLMLHRGYVQNYLSSFYYLPPLKKQRSIKKWSILNEMGKMVALFPSAFYCLVVQKREADLIGPGIWQTQRPYVPSMDAPLQPSCLKSIQQADQSI